MACRIRDLKGKNEEQNTRLFHYSHVSVKAVRPEVIMSYHVHETKASCIQNLDGQMEKLREGADIATPNGFDDSSSKQRK